MKNKNKNNGKHVRGLRKYEGLAVSILALGFIYFDTYIACKTLRSSGSVASVSSFLVFYLFFWVLLFLPCWMSSYIQLNPLSPQFLFFVLFPLNRSCHLHHLWFVCVY